MKIYNSLTFKKEEFKPLKENEILMYVCGPTVYDSPHLGHAKSAVIFDIIRRFLKFKGYDVKLVKNYTDIDDKIIKRAIERNIDYNTLSEQYISEYEEIMKILNVEKDYKNPRATEVIDTMIEIVKDLISKNHAYVKNGSVYFSVESFPKYKSILQNISEEELESEEGDGVEDGETLEIGEKRDLRDFALWKKSKENEPYWESPWGKGRPGWHVECTAMAIKYLGETIDIHGGGQDLKFPHHRNEITQSEAYTGKPFANYFMHNGFVNVDNEKMSKSLGNFFLVSDVVKEFDPMVIRFFLISSHYRKSINYSVTTITQAKKNYSKIINTIRKIYEFPADGENTGEIVNLISKIECAELGIINAMEDDFNTPVGFAELMTLFRSINQTVLEKKIKLTAKFKDSFFKFINKIDKIFGLFLNVKKELDLSIAGSFDERGVLIEKILNIISEIRSLLREKKVFDISVDIRDRINDFWVRKELDLGLGGSFDERGQLIKDLLETLNNLTQKLKYKKLPELSNELEKNLSDLGIKEDLDLNIAGSFDKRGELIDRLVEIFTNIRSKLRELGSFDIIDFICENLSQFWIKRALDVELAGSFDKRGQLIEELLDLLRETRSKLRKRRIYEISDIIRERLRKLGIFIEDY